jgi:hypothetical protein
MQPADPIGESTDGQVGAQTSNRLSVPRSRTRLSFVKMRRSTIAASLSPQYGKCLTISRANANRFRPDRVRPSSRLLPRRERRRSG